MHHVHISVTTKNYIKTVNKNNYFIGTESGRCEILILNDEKQKYTSVWGGRGERWELIKTTITQKTSIKYLEYSNM